MITVGTEKKYIENTENSEDFDPGWSNVRKWLEYSPSIIKKIKQEEPFLFIKIKNRVAEYAQFCVVRERLNELEREITHDHDRSFKLICAFGSAIIGSLFYERGLYLLMASLGIFAGVASWMAALAAAGAADFLSTTALTNRLCSLYQKQVLDRAKENNDYHKNRQLSELQKELIEGKIFFVRRMEKNFIIRGFPVNLILTIFLNIIEYLSALYIVQQILGLLNDIEIPFFLQMVIGLFPIALTWTLAHIKAQKFGLLEYRKNIKDRYIKELNYFKNNKDQKKEDDKLDSEVNVLLKTINILNETEIAHEAYDNEKIESEDRKLLVSLIHEYSEKLVTLCGKIEDNKRKYIIIELFSTTIVILVPIFLLSMCVYLWNQNVSPLSLNFFSAKFSLILPSILVLVIIFTFAVYGFFIISSGGKKMRAFKREARMIASRLENVILIASPIEENLKPYLITKVELDLRLADAESALEYYYEIIEKK